ncbi:MAG: hypothetical protein APF77_10990 [Clostridia bacterium BRH_c25]|nr:MAG: hypothetical protein APF77_10990 [Clostridia bacterium BRH_c25]
MINKPEVSVVLGSYNRLEFLKLTIESVRKEIEGINCEIIVVDGGSTDGAMEWLIKQKDIVTIIQHNNGEWLGKRINKRSWGYFMNLGFKCAQGKYICMISDDCLIVPNAIKNGYALFEKAIGNGEKVGAIAFYWRDWPIENEYEVRLTLGEKMYVNHGMYLNEALKQISYADEDTFEFYFADGDLCLKMWQSGYKCIDSPDSYIEHCTHVNFKVKKSNNLRLYEEVEKYKKKWYGIYYDEKNNSISTRIKKTYTDLQAIAEGFRPHYEREIEKRKHEAQTQLSRINRIIGVIDNNSNIVIYGAGVHTEMLFKHTCLKEKKITGIVDMQKHGELFDSFKVSEPKYISEVIPDIVLISSFSFQNQIGNHLCNDLRYKGQIIRLYKEDDAEPFYVHI